MEEIKHCIDCGKEIYGRVDKKFCNDYCRNNYHAKNNRESNNYMRNVNNVLRKNRKILEVLNPEGKKKVTKDVLAAKGFNFHYFTNSYTTKTGNTYYFCYEHGFMELDNDWLALVIKYDYIK